VVVQDRFGFGVLVVEAPGGLGGEEKIVVNERHGLLSMIGT
jgi:hypothetical protein